MKITQNSEIVKVSTGKVANVWLLGLDIWLNLGFILHISGTQTSAGSTWKPCESRLFDPNSKAFYSVDLGWGLSSAILVSYQMMQTQADLGNHTLNALAPNVGYGDWWAQTMNLLVVFGMIVPHDVKWSLSPHKRPCFHLKCKDIFIC